MPSIWDAYNTKYDDYKAGLIRLINAFTGSVWICRRPCRDILKLPTRMRLSKIIVVRVTAESSSSLDCRGVRGSIIMPSGSPALSCQGRETLDPGQRPKNGTPDRNMTGLKADGNHPVSCKIRSTQYANAWHPLSTPKGPLAGFQEQNTIAIYHLLI